MRKQASTHQIEIQIDEQFQGRVQPEPLQQAAMATLAHQEVVGACELAVVITDDEALHELNLRYRHVDEPTDVLAFPNETRGPFVNAPGLPRYLGDVIISLPRAEAQAGEAGHDLLTELQLLVVHGILHLLGHDDIVDEKRARMWAAQSAILSSLGVEARLPEW
ncbi:MAG: rRNA maturation RNase YbeY [Anaerolineae bacterium]|nr:rRNA maturation RNase YbeY [Anaerolineae bacterium]